MTFGLNAEKFEGLGAQRGMQGQAQIGDTVELLEHALVIPGSQTGALQPRLLLGSQAALRSNR